MRHTEVRHSPLPPRCRYERRPSTLLVTRARGNNIHDDRRRAASSPSRPASKHILKASGSLAKHDNDTLATRHDTTRHDTTRHDNDTTTTRQRHDMTSYRQRQRLLANTATTNLALPPETHTTSPQIHVFVHTCRTWSPCTQRSMHTSPTP